MQGADPYDCDAGVIIHFGGDVKPAKKQYSHNSKYLYVRVSRTTKVWWEASSILLVAGLSSFAPVLV